MSREPGREKAKKLADYEKEGRELVQKSPTGRALLRAADKLDMAPISPDETLSASNVGVCVNGPKAPRILFNPAYLQAPGDDRDKGLFLDTWIHEMAHGVVRPAFNEKWRTRLEPGDQMFSRRLDESGAVAHSLQVSWELKEAGHPEMWDYMTGKGFSAGDKTFRSAYAETATAYRESVEADVENGRNGTAMKTAFLSRLTGEEKVNRHYNNRYLACIEGNLKTPTVMLDKGMMPSDQLRTLGPQFCETSGAGYVVDPRPLKEKDVDALMAHLPKNPLAGKDGAGWVLKPENRGSGMSRQENARLSHVNSRMKNLRRTMGYPAEPLAAEPIVRRQDRSR